MIDMKGQNSKYIVSRIFMAIVKEITFHAGQCLSEVQGRRRSWRSLRRWRRWRREGARNIGGSKSIPGSWIQVLEGALLFLSLYSCTAVYQVVYLLYLVYLVQAMSEVEDEMPQPVW